MSPDSVEACQVGRGGQNVSRQDSSAFGPVTISILFSLLLCVVTWFSVAHLGFNLLDEGFLWDGVLRTLNGAVPLRDFNSYDVGRYYWCAAFMKFLGRGLLEMRFACLAYQVVGLALSFFMLFKYFRSWPLTALAVISTSLWCFWVFRSFEYTDSIVAVFAGYMLVQQPSPRRFFSLGMASGLVALFGRNHGLYAATANILLFVFLISKKLVRPNTRVFCAWIFGLVIGYLPMLLMLAFVPGFLEGNLWQLQRLFRWGHSNLPLPYPWLWNVTAPIYGGTVAHAMFTVLPATALAGLFVLAKATTESIRQQPLLAAAVPAGLCFFFHASSRSDLVHLAEASQPLLLAGLALMPMALSCERRQAFAITTLVFSVISVFSLYQVHPALQAWRDKGRGVEWVETDVNGQRLLLPPLEADFLGRFRQLKTDFIKDDNFAVFPAGAGLYGFVGRTASVFNTFDVYPVPPDEEDELIATLHSKAVRWVFVFPEGIDGRQDLTFPETHPRVWRFLNEEYVLDWDLSRYLGRIVFRLRRDSR